MSDLPPKDSRGFFMLPQAPEQSGYGYYTYGTPLHGGGQYVHPKLLSLLFMVEHAWEEIDDRQIGIGNISLAGGVEYDHHATHKSGLDVDVRLVRLDGKHENVTRFDTQYDSIATATLISLFFDLGDIKVIYFNDAEVPRVKHWDDHDNHFHVTIKP